MMLSEADVEAARDNKAFQGQREGRLPNVYWRAISWEVLRSSARFEDAALPPHRGRRRRRGEGNRAKFVGLPPEESVSLDHLTAWRLVRQSSPLWSQAHKGVVSSGRIAAALGFFEPEIAPRVGLPRHQWSQYPFSEALQNLHGHVCEISHLPQRQESVEETLEVLWLTSSTESSGIAIDEKAEQSSSQEHAPAAMSHDIARNGASSLAGQGISGVRSKWGRVQEPGFLLRLSEALPDSYRISEVGLCMLTRKQVQSLGLGPELYEQLPPMGASPDAMLWVSKSSKLKDNTVTGWSLVGCIELKSLCPFQLAQKGRRSGRKGSERFSLRDRLSTWQITPQIVAQCQLQMLCTETESIVIAARALSGITMFKMQRDNEYLRALLHLCSRLRGVGCLDREDALRHLTCWKAGSYHNDDRELRSYGEFVQRTREIARRVNRESSLNEDPYPSVPKFIEKSWSDTAIPHISPKPKFLFLD